MTMLIAAALPGLALTVALAGCSPGNDDLIMRRDGAAAAGYRPLTSDYAPNFMARTSIGRVMTTPQGATIYTFGKDEIGKSNCRADCATQWPPIIAAAEARPYGRMSLVYREDGRRQWAYDGRPLYTYADDETHGDVKGENVGNVWHVVR